MIETATTPQAGPPDPAAAVALIGAPSDIGAAQRGASMGPEALRVAGLGPALSALGRRVIDHGNLAGPANPDAPARDGHRHLDETASWCRAVRDAVRQSLRTGQFPVMLGGDHALSIGSVAAVAAHCNERGIPLTVLWLDAHADFNTPDTSPSGNIHGMPVAILTGAGHATLTDLGHATPVIDAGDVIQVGIRSIDAAEKRLVADSGLVVHDMRRIDEAGMRAVMEDALDRAAARGGHLHVSLDVDFLDPSIAPGVGTTVRGGPDYREAQLCMEMIHDSGLMGSLDIVELNPAFDIRNQTAEHVVELVRSLFGERILHRRASASRIGTGS
jgi:arginase